MAAFRKQVTHLLGIDVVQQIVEDEEARSAASVLKICRHALVKIYVPLLQFCRRGIRGLLAISPYHPPSKSRSVHRASRFCRNRTQDDLPDPLDPLIMHVNGRLSLRSSLMGRQTRMEYLSPRNPSYRNPNWSDVCSHNSRRLKNEILLILSSCSVTIETNPPPSSSV